MEERKNSVSFLENLFFFFRSLFWEVFEVPIWKKSKLLLFWAELISHTHFTKLKNYFSYSFLLSNCSRCDPDHKLMKSVTDELMWHMRMTWMFKRFAVIGWFFEILPAQPIRATLLKFHVTSFTHTHEKSTEIWKLRTFLGVFRLLTGSSSWLGGADGFPEKSMRRMFSRCCRA